MEVKLAIINRMVGNGYQLMNRTPEEMATIFTVEELANMELQYNEWRSEK